MKRILITGAGGFIGRNSIKFFREQGYDVYGIDQFAGEYYGTKIESVDLLEADFGTCLEEIRPDVILHCAGCADVGKSIINPYADFQGNTVVLHKMLFSMKEHGFGDVRFIFLSSAAVYGQPKALPISEASALSPMSPYALHKKMGEDICLYFNANYHFNIKIARIFSAFGPGLCKQIFWDMKNKVENTGCLDMWGTGEESRDYIYITDIMQALFLLAKDETDKEDIYNIANGQEITIRCAAEVFAKARGLSTDIIQFNGKVREGDPLNWRADISRLKNIGYTQHVSFESGIDEYVLWCRDLEM